jgi:hypothetical protein
MRVYYKLDNIEIDSDEYSVKNLADLANIAHYHMMEAVKYKIMWALRSLEKQIDESGGIILIDSKGLQDIVKISAKDFDEELAEKIQNIAAKTKL